MAKKNFQRAPKPQGAVSHEAIEAFEKGGVGNDVGKKSIKPGNANSKEPTKRLSIDLPESVHQRFKTACSATSRKMTQEIELFITERTTELEKEAGITRK
mgnify:FL=1|jgi:hypothetical protein|tara:strand:- start:1562 stop:1861 length:300 start_codon:yes stop_codon:yes gene_type:complete